EFGRFVLAICIFGRRAGSWKAFGSISIGVGTTAANGMVFGWLHGEYDPWARSYRLHVHVVVQGEKTERLRTLKGRWGYETVDGETKRPIVFEKIKAPAWKKHATRKQSPSPIENVARALSYAHQSFWSCRP